MKREFYLELAERKLRMPIGTDLVMHQEREPQKVRVDGVALGKVVQRSAQRWSTPLAVPLMDLRLEKIDLLALAGVPEKRAERYHFSSPIDPAVFAWMCGEQKVPFCAGSCARDEALAYIGENTDLVPVGMAIGPFSLTTRLACWAIRLPPRRGPAEGHRPKSRGWCVSCGNALKLPRPPFSVRCAVRSRTAQRPSWSASRLRARPLSRPAR